ncbi:MAG: hypothetical protein M9925_13510 [Chloroflexi bacterium]|jgi:hypothetical protein|nr:hypothetical protein [Chloroflexota bacterium]MCZ7578122.1 hypothetical protein [Dehalococcoidia bacterium]NJD63936.1 hypothetical protein [Chloroflexota bacterium]PWB41443.1 MAG: hypothetical protein C3F10_15450 [Dehalococcoidia bacterium]
MTQQAKFTVSERDREHFRKIGRYVVDANRAAREEWLALPGTERIAKSEQLARRYRTRERVEAALAEDNPAPLYKRARRLGLTNR